MALRSSKEQEVCPPKQRGGARRAIWRPREIIAVQLVCVCQSAIEPLCLSRSHTAARTCKENTLSFDLSSDEITR